jgi:hypothetical protein
VIERERQRLRSAAAAVNEDDEAPGG